MDRVSSGDPIYLDFNATTPIAKEVVDAMLPFLREHFGNPSSGHVYGHRAKAAVERAREQVAALLSAEPDEIVFTSGGTEANNLAIRGVVLARPDRPEIVTSVIEHPATSQPCAFLEAHGTKVTRAGVDAQGIIRLEEATRALSTRTALLTVVHANNETGVLQPVRGLADAAHRVGAIVHTDAAQSVGKVPVDVRALGVDLLSIAGHKLYAPKGVGALYRKREKPLAPFVLGAGHERGLRPGTENVPHLVGLGAACELAARDLETRAARMRELRDRLLSALVAEIPDLVLNGHPEHRLPNTLNVRFPGASGTALLARAPEIAASTGAACHEGHESASSVILAMGVAPEEALGSVRLTLGATTTEADVDEAARALVRAHRTH